MSVRGNKVVGDIQRVVDQEDTKKSAIARQLHRNEQAQEEQRRIKFDSLAKMSDILLESKLDKNSGQNVRMISADIEHLLAQREKHYGEIESTVEGDRQELKLAQEGHARAKQDLDQLKETIYAEIAGNPAIQDLRKRVEQARIIADSAESLTEAISDEARAKLQSYKQDVVFQHLVARKYGTDDYVGSGLYARLDGWLAGRVNFSQSRHDYNMLLALPAAAKGRESEVEKTHEQLQRELDAAIELVRSTHNLHGAERKLHAASEKLRLCQEHINRDQDAINSFLNKTDDMMRRVRQRAKEVLAQFSIPTLERLVNSTATGEDNLALDNYQQAVRREKQLQEEEQKLQAQLREAEESFRRAKRARDMFKNADYDRTDRRFESGFDMNSLMLGYMAGQLSLNDLSNRCSRDSSIVRESSPSVYGSMTGSSSSSSWDSFSSSDRFGGSSSSSSSSDSFGSSSSSFSSSDSF